LGGGQNGCNERCVMQTTDVRDVWTCLFFSVNHSNERPPTYC